MVRLDGLGDVLLTLPWLGSWRRRFPEQRISVLVSDDAAGALRADPAVDRVLSWPRNLTVAARSWRALRELRRERFDTVVIPRAGRDYYSAKWVALLTGAPLRLGFREHGPVSGPTPRPDAFLSHAVDRPHGVHEAQAPFCLIGDPPPLATLRIDLPRTSDAELAADAIVDGHPDGRWFAIAPGARESKRRWPPERFASCAVELERRGCRCLIIGGADASESAAVIRRLCPSAVDLTGQLPVLHIVAVLRRCFLVLTNDSAAAHLASGARTPSVVVSCHPETGDPEADNSPHRFRPLGPGHLVIQPPGTRPCRQCCTAPQPHCILGVGVDRVVGAAESAVRSRG